MSNTTEEAKLTTRDFTTDQEVRWCPGCGNYSILGQVRKVLPKLGYPRENFLFVSGIGCSSRFPYYMNTYGVHGIHGRALPLAMGAKCANPDLQVWVITGDGDGLSIGGNHFLHTIRRNPDIVVLLLNNRIYGLTKGQYSPTSELGKRTKTSPQGAIDYPVRALSIAIAAEASFVSRAIDVDVKHLEKVLIAAAEHKGTSFVEIYQDCNIFNHNAFAYATDKSTRDDNILYLEHDHPLIFGKNHDKGIRMSGAMPEVVQLGHGISKDDLLCHDERTQNPSLAFMLSRMKVPLFPEPVGIYRRVHRPCYEVMMEQQITEAVTQHGEGDISLLLEGTESWEVK